ncbi:LytR/AlgR family response regulator transcription factor [Faecalicatena orotica]|uniref:LytR/AlgR family response regulator transcription factor n=1 Tax=Faecalicatena orotica TaxID=1544 RepID=UPI003216D18C
MVIGICDDDKNWCIEAGKRIEDYAGRVFLNVEVNYFENEEQLLRYEGSPMEVLFLDIELEGKNGIQAAQRVNEKWKNCQIVYLTNYLYYATEVYSTIHTFFVLKEQFEAKIGEIFQKVEHELEQQEKKLVFDVIGYKEVVLAPNEILYFERMKRTTNIVTVWGVYGIWDKIKDIEGRLPKIDFVRCHNSYIVYLPAVREMRKDSFLMNNEAKVMISRAYAKNTKGAFMKWALTQMS